MLVRTHPLFRRKLRRWLNNLILSTIVLTSCCYLYGTKIEPNWIEVVSISLDIPQLDQSFDNFKLVQISDLHFSKFMPEERLNKIIGLVNRQHPDAIAITGDIITKHSHFDPIQLQLQLSQFQSRFGAVSVLGNHDHWPQAIDELKAALNKSHINHLDNQVFVISSSTGQKFALAGIDDPYWGQPDLDKTLAQLPQNTPAILLVHEPDYIEISSKTRRFALQLSGHSHGGQIKIPFLHPLILPRGGKKYFAGLNRVGDTLTYTNRGLGMTNLPIRFGSRPEITIFTLHPQA